MLDTFIKISKYLLDRNTKAKEDEHAIAIMYMEALAEHARQLCDIWEDTAKEIGAIDHARKQHSEHGSNLAFIDSLFDNERRLFERARRPLPNSKQIESLEQTLERLEKFRRVPSVTVNLDGRETRVTSQVLDLFSETVADLLSEREGAKDLVRENMAAISGGYEAAASANQQSHGDVNLFEHVDAMKKKTAKLEANILEYRAASKSF